MDVSKEGKTSKEAFSSRRAVPMGFNREEREEKPRKTLLCLAIRENLL